MDWFNIIFLICVPLLTMLVIAVNIITVKPEQVTLADTVVLVIVSFIPLVNICICLCFASSLFWDRAKSVVIYERKDKNEF